jgi:hypothetical protein
VLVQKSKAIEGDAAAVAEKGLWGSFEQCIRSSFCIH